MGHFVMVSIWCASISTSSRFRFLYFRMNNCKANATLHQVKELPNDSGRPLSYNKLPIKNKMAATKKQCFFFFFFFFFFFCVFCIEPSLHLPSFKVRGFTNNYKFCISVDKYQQ